MKVRDVMSRPARTIGPDTPVRDILRKMVDSGVSGFPVVDGEGNLLGFVPESALMARVVEPRHEHGSVQEFVKQQRRLYGSTAADVMHRNVISIEDSADVMEAIQIMLREKVSRLPVLRRGKVVGYLSRTDILRTVLEVEERRAQRAQQPTDEDVRRRALDVLHSFLGATALSVGLNVHNGVVELTGTVDEAAHSSEIEQLMRALPGVKGVNNQLLVNRLLD